MPTVSISNACQHASGCIH